MPVEDHPLDYADFEGVIPAGQYGAGAVVVWDRGSYDNLTERDGKPQPIGQALRDGHVVIELHGEKLKGGYALQRVARGEDERWLLIKLKDEAADARRRPTSSRAQVGGERPHRRRARAGGQACRSLRPRRCSRSRAARSGCRTPTRCCFPKRA